MVGIISGGPRGRGSKLRAKSLLYAIRRHDAECI